MAIFDLQKKQFHMVKLIAFLATEKVELNCGGYIENLLCAGLVLHAVRELKMENIRSLFLGRPQPSEGLTTY